MKQRNKLDWLRAAIKFVEKPRGGLVFFVLSLVALSALRIFLEQFSSLGRTFVPFLGAIIHPTLLYAVIILVVSAIVALITREKIRRITSATLLAWSVVLIVPIVDFIASKGVGNYRTAYLFEGWPTLWRDFLSFFSFGTEVNFGITLGMRVQIGLFLLLALLYLAIKTKNWWKTIGGTVLLYVVTFFFAALPSLIYVVTQGWREAGWATANNVIGFWMGSGELWNAPLTMQAVQGFDLRIIMVLLPLLGITALGWFAIYKWKILKELIKTFRWQRLALYFFAIGAGFLLALKVFPDSQFDHSFFGIAAALRVIIGALGAWGFSKHLNDHFDYSGDKLSHPKRLLPRKIITPELNLTLAWLFGGLALVSVYPLGFSFTFTVAAILFVNILYSAQPFRIKRWPIATQFFLGLNILLLVFLGFLLLSPARDFTAFPPLIIVMVLLFAGLLAPLKDFGDEEGDAVQQVLTLPVIFGPKHSRWIAALLVFIAFMSVPLLLQTQSLLLISLGFGVLAAMLVLRPKIYQPLFFLVTGAFWLVTYLVAF
ncbi:UbiA family prenyltransferase [Patescibacteria group bacterium]